MSSMRALLSQVLLLLATHAAAFHAGGAAPHLRCRRTRPAAMAQDSNQCAVIELRSNEPVKLAKVLRKAWMEGGVKRGLSGAVVVPDDSSAEMVQIIAQGNLERVKEFGAWCEKQLDIDEGKVDVIEMDLEACPAVPLSSKFKLEDMPRGKASEPWRNLLAKSYDEEGASATKLHSSDEGLA